MLNVVVTTCGDHNHLSSGEAAELISALLEKAGYTDPSVEWRARVDKELHADSKTPPIRVVRSKVFGLVLKIKPQPNATYLQVVTLLLPDNCSFSAEKLFVDLKGVWRSINRFWRKRPKSERLSRMDTLTNMVKSVVPTEVAQAPIAAPFEEELDWSALKGICNNRKKLAFVLKRIYELSKDGISRNKVEFVETIKRMCGWEHHLTRIVSRVLSELHRNDYIQEMRNTRSALSGYSLTALGLGVLGIKDEAPSADQSTSPAEPGLLELRGFILHYASRSRELTDVCNKIEQNEQKRKELMKQVSQLDQEDQQLLTMFSGNKMLYHLLRQVQQHQEEPKTE